MAAFLEGVLFGLEEGRHSPQRWAAAVGYPLLAHRRLEIGGEVSDIAKLRPFLGEIGALVEYPGLFAFGGFCLPMLRMMLRAWARMLFDGTAIFLSGSTAFQSAFSLA